MGQGKESGGNSLREPRERRDEIIAAVKAKASEGMAFPIGEEEEAEEGDLLEKAELEIEEGVLSITLDEEEK